jgi:hypothetical protein
LRPPLAGITHHVADHRQQQLVLAREVSVERLQRDTSLGDEFLGGELIALGLNERPSRVQHLTRVVGDTLLRPLH